MLRRCLGPLFVIGALVTSTATGANQPTPTASATVAHVFAIDDGSRLRREDVDSPLGRGQGNPIWRAGGPVRLSALRDEVVAFQIVVEAGDVPVERVTVDLSALARRGAPDVSLSRIDRYLEHYVEVRGRSRNDRRPRESLGWNPGARPRDEDVLGHVPDALVPIELAQRSQWLEYPFAVAPHTTSAVWIDVYVPADAVPGTYEGSVRIASGDRALDPVDVSLEVVDALLPYRAVSFFAFYDASELRGRIGDSDAAERQLWQLLHAHHVDAIAPIRAAEDVRRLLPALEGSLFRPEQGYVGPGVAVAPAIVALGAYGVLGDATEQSLARAAEALELVPPATKDVFLYAVDEQCDSPRGPTWKRLVQRTPSLARLRIAHTCSEDPARQDVDIAIVIAQAFDERTAARARATGRSVWVYNGALPRTGTMLLDAPVTSLRASAWISATRPVGRWFLWETTFWNDDNKGGHGPVDPFVVAETFHNNDGDSGLGDGLLLYPGSQLGKMADHSLGFSGVLPSMRLKNLRRGIQDAGILALARAARKDAADAVARKLVPASLADVSVGSATPWPANGAPFHDAREALRALVPNGASLTADDVESVLHPPTETPGTSSALQDGLRGSVWRTALFAVAAVFAAGAVFIVLARARRR